MAETKININGGVPFDEIEPLGSVLDAVRAATQGEMESVISGQRALEIAEQEWLQEAGGNLGGGPLAPPRRETKKRVKKVIEEPAPPVLGNVEPLPTPAKVNSGWHGHQRNHETRGAA